MSVRALIVDDERLARVALRRLLAEHPTIEIVGEASDVEAAALAVTQLQPDLVFLDVEMPPSTGFDLFALAEPQARVIFVTAFPGHALRAFDVNALDYLLKPVRPERLAEALARLDRGPRLVSGTSAGPSHAAPLASDDLVCVPTGRGGARFFRISSVDLLQASDDYAELLLADGSSLLSARPLAQWEQRLPASFVRVHRGVIVNTARIREIVREGGASYALRLIGRDISVPVRRGLGPSLIERFRHGLG